MSRSAVREHVAGELSDVAWDASLLRDELEPGPNTSLMLRSDSISRVFYVFRAGKLRTIYTMFEALAFPEGNFTAFAAMLQRRFGPGALREGELVRGTRVRRRWIEWRSRTTRVRAVDQTNHRGFYCLILEDQTHR